MPDTPSSSSGTGPVGSGDYTVKQGDCIASIALEHGHFWETIWEHPENRELREVRGDPNVLLAGDKVFIPGTETGEEPGETESKHVFRRKGVPEMLRVVLKDDKGEPRAGASYVLTIDGLHRDGVTDDGGRLEEPIPPDAREGHLTVLDEHGNKLEDYDLALGNLDPVSEVTGVQMRLNNLGSDCGDADGELGTRTTQALKRFQEEHGLEPTGELDDETRAKIKEAHGS